MRKRLVVLTCIILTVVLITPQIAQPVPQDETIKEAVKPAIEAGIEYLKRTHLANGVWDYQGQSNPAAEQVIGCAALCGIALMECNVSTSDKHVKDVASVVRSVVSNPNFNYNYGSCLGLLFLDRFHRGQNTNHSDSALIKRLANKIAAGQCPDGGWTYQLPGGANSDNSNTQFAVVALWVSRKYSPGPLIDRALKNADAKFRKSQRGDGGWGYDAANIQVALEATGSMTCAGILGIALNAGTRAQPQEAAFRGAGAGGSTADVYKALETDPQVAKARAFLLGAFKEYIENKSKHGHITYFFWSLERVATLYRWRKLDDAKEVDWFELGARYLMRIQQRNGSWNADFLQGPAVDTSFALLFLAKSNLLGSLQETSFTGGALGAGGTALVPKKKEPEKKNHEQLAKETAGKLLTALAGEREALLNELRDGRGEDYTDALVEVIGKLDTNSAKESAREALASRLQRMKATTLNAFMRDDHRELRLAAAVAVRFKNDTEAATGLIPLLADQDIGVSTAALESLKAISNQDFGKSVERWSRWLETNKAKKPE